MSSCKRAATSAAALSIFIAASPAFADLTAEQVWADWQDYMASTGYAVDATTSRSGDTLTVSDLSMSIAIPEEDVDVSVTMQEFSLTENGDGTVAISMPPVTPLVVSIKDGSGEGVDINLDYKTNALAMNVSGDANDMVYTYSAAEVAVELADVSFAGQSVDIGTAMMSFANIAGSTTMVVGDVRNSVQEMTTGAVSYALDFADPEGGDGRLTLNGGVASMDLSAATAIPGEFDPNNLGDMLAKGFDVEAEFSYEGGSLNFNFQEHGDVVQVNSSSDSGGLYVAMGNDGLSYSLGSAGQQVAMSGGDIPFPVELSANEIGFSLTMPIAKSDEEQDFALGVTLEGFAVSDLIWSIIDAPGQLPHDPATVILDTSGKVKLFFHLMVMVESGEAMPGELNELTLHELVVSAAGAELTGQGAFTFNNEDLSTFDGIPAPTGSVDLMLVGGNGLLDTLVAMGLVPEEEAMGARMMMGLFAIPGEGEDTLTSTIEVNGDGSISANGQRLR